MSPPLTRRDLLASSVALSGAAVSATLLPGPRLLAQGSPNEKLNVACIGAGGRGGAHVNEAFTFERVVALADVDDNNLGRARKKVSSKNPGVRGFTDFRKMFDAMAREIDAVFVATPDHTHAAAAMAAIRAGTGKKLAWDGPGMRFTNDADANAFLRRAYRTGWTLG